MNKPNLLFIMTDQQRFDALGANGNPIVQTPNMDALAKSGVNIRDYYTNCPVCVPSRCTLFTGRYPHAHRIRENYNLLEAGREFHLFRVLKQEGYAIAYTGKNYLLEDAERENFDFLGYGDDKKAAEKELMDWYAERRSEIGVPSDSPEIWKAGMFHDFPKESTRTWQTAQGGIDFLQQHDRSKPFCLCVSFSDPHVPHLAPRKFEKMYPPEHIELFPAPEGELETKARRFKIKQGAFHAEKATDDDKRHYIAVYYAMISWVDEMIGEIMETLKARGFDKNTIIVFTADHGDFCFEHGLAKKDLVLLNSLLHVPMIIAWPGQLAPSVVEDTLMEEVDVLPTLLELMGIEIPFGVQGESIAPVLRGERMEHRDAAFAEIDLPWMYNPYPDYESFSSALGGYDKHPFNVPGDFTKSIRERDFRYVWYGTGEEELYDEQADPHELNNLAGNPAYAETKNRLKMRLMEWHVLTEDPLDPHALRELQDRYGDWKPRSIPAIPEHQRHSPRWVELRRAPKPRKP